MSDNWTERSEDKQDGTEELRGRIRALEAIILELAEISPDLIRAAKESLRQRWKNENRQWGRLIAEMNRPYDNHAEAALDALIRDAESKTVERR
jgi:hypothetical protein